MIAIDLSSLRLWAVFFLLEQRDSLLHAGIATQTTIKPCRLRLNRNFLVATKENSHTHVSIKTSDVQNQKAATPSSQKTVAIGISLQLVQSSKRFTNPLPQFNLFVSCKFVIPLHLVFAK
jgi:hypothetical protein